MISYILIAVAVYGTLVALMFTFQRTLLYHPSAGLMDPAAHGLPEMRRVTLETDDGLLLTSWHKEAGGGRQTLVYFHGNAGHIGHRASKVKPYLDAGYGVLLVGYRGYGSNPGSPTEENLLLDGKAALDFLGRENVPISKIVLYGESLGTGVAVALAQNKGINALILEAPFSSIADVAAQHYFYVPARHLVKDKYNSVSRIKNVDAPLLLIHGQRDRIVPWKFGKILFDHARKPKEHFSIPEASHNNLYDFGVPRKVIEFMEKNSRYPLSL